MKTILFIFTLIIGSQAYADSLDAAASQLCGKIETCGMEHLAEEPDLPQEMLEMAKTMYSQMCATVTAPYVNQTKDAGLQKKAIACLEAINALECEELMEGEGEESAACIEFEEAAAEAGLLENN